MFSLYILDLCFHYYYVIETYTSFCANNLIVLVTIEKTIKRLMIEKVFITQIDYSQ